MIATRRHVQFAILDPRGRTLDRMFGDLRWEEMDLFIEPRWRQVTETVAKWDRFSRKPMLFGWLNFDGECSASPKQSDHRRRTLLSSNEPDTCHAHPSISCFGQQRCVSSCNIARRTQQKMENLIRSCWCHFMSTFFVRWRQASLILLWSNTDDESSSTLTIRQDITTG